MVKAGPAGGDKAPSVEVEASSSGRDHHDAGGIAAASAKAVLPRCVVVHDQFNLVYIAVLNAINCYYLATGKRWDLLFWATAMYFVVDMLWVAVVPASVKSPEVIMFHHIITTLFMALPYRYTQYSSLMAHCLLVEINTWLLIAKRNYRSMVLEVLFYSTWVLLRNIYYPYLCWEFYKIYKAETDKAGTPWNPILLGPILQCGLTALNYHWTITLLVNVARKRASSAKQHQL